MKNEPIAYALKTFVAELTKDRACVVEVHNKIIRVRFGPGHVEHMTSGQKVTLTFEDGEALVLDHTLEMPERVGSEESEARRPTPEDHAQA